MEGETGFSFPSGDVAALADRLRWIRDPDAWERMATGARARISGDLKRTWKLAWLSFAS